MSLPPTRRSSFATAASAAPRLGPWHGSIAIARSSLQLLARRKLFWALYVFSLLIFLFFFFGQYLMVFLENRVSESMVRTGGLFARNMHPEFVTQMLRDALHMDGSADTFGDFMWTEGYIVMVILAFAGSVIVGNDFQHNSLPFYLSKPIGRRHYLVGKALAVAVLVNAMTTVPAVALFIEYGFIDTWDYYVDQFRLLRRHPGLRGGADGDPEPAAAGDGDVAAADGAAGHGVDGRVRAGPAGAALAGGRAGHVAAVAAARHLEQHVPVRPVVLRDGAPSACGR